MYAVYFNLFSFFSLQAESEHNVDFHFDIASHIAAATVCLDRVFPSLDVVSDVSYTGGIFITFSDEYSNEN